MEIRQSSAKEAHLIQVVLEGPALGLLGSLLSSGLLQGLRLGPLLLPGLHALPPALCLIIQRGLLLFLDVPVTGCESMRSAGILWIYSFMTLSPHVTGWR